MNIKKYTDYIKYIMEHKKNVFIECINMSKKYTGKEKRELIFHAFTHDLSKFSPKEFFAYAKWFYSEYGTQYTNKIKEFHKDKEKFLDEQFNKPLEHHIHELLKENFDKAWQHHKDKNKHHWNYWSERNLNMPAKYIRQMICDWRAMARKFGDTAESFYLKNYNKIQLSHDSRLFLEHQLDVIAPVAFTCECDSGYWMTLKELIEDSLEWEKRNNQKSRWLRNEAIPWYKEKFNLDIFTLLKNEI